MTSSSASTQRSPALLPGAPGEVQETSALPEAELSPYPPPDAATWHPQHPVHHIVFPHLLETARSFLSVIVIALFVLTFIVQPFRIPSESMERTLLVGDFLLVNKMAVHSQLQPLPPAIHAASARSSLWSWPLPYRDVQRGDIIVFHFPIQPAEHLVKRVIGIPGDRVRLVNGTVYLNGEPQREPYALYRPSYPDPFRDQFPNGQFTDPGVDARWWLSVRRSLQNDLPEHPISISHGGEITVPANHYFVLGDNRNNSRDSRYWGFVPAENIVGRPFVIYFSIRGISPTEQTPLLGDTLAHGNNMVSALLDFARWDRMFQIVR